MKIKYTLWSYKEGKPRNRKNMIFEYGEIEFPCTWEDGEEHTELRKAIYAKNPGKNLMGYCPSELFEEFKDSINADNPDIILH